MLPKKLSNAFKATIISIMMPNVGRDGHKSVARANSLNINKDGQCNFYIYANLSLGK